MRNRLVLGQWNVVCDVCGLKHKSGELRRRWDGMMVCKDDYETRHPQDLIRINKEVIAPPWTRPEPPDVFISLPSFITDENGQYLLLEDGSFLFSES